MKKQIAASILALASLTTVQAARAQEKTQNTAEQGSRSPGPDVRQKNIQEYINLLRSDVRQQKDEFLGAVMVLSADDAKKFWPIYYEYDAELTKLNDLRAANIQEYARNYTQLTDEQADALMDKALAYDKQRSELLTKYYGRVKQELGAVTAARFVEIEQQLLSIIDLRTSSALPIAGQGQ